MSIKDATPQDIQAMKDRLDRKWSDRWNDVHMDDAVKMACRANRPPFAEKSQTPKLESVIVATGMMATAGAAAILGNAGAVPMGYAAAVAGIAVFGATVQIIQEARV